MARNEVQYRMRCRTPAAIFAAVACLVLTFSQPAASLADDAMTARYNPEAETAGAGEIAACCAADRSRHKLRRDECLPRGGHRTAVSGIAQVFLACLQEQVPERS